MFWKQEQNEEDNLEYLDTNKSHSKHLQTTSFRFQILR